MADRGIDRAATVGPNKVGEHRLRRLPRHLADGKDSRLWGCCRDSIQRACLLNRPLGGDAGEEQISASSGGDLHDRADLIAEVAAVFNAEHVAVELPPRLAAVNRLLRLPGMARGADPDHRFPCREKRLQRGHLGRAEPPPPRREDKDVGVGESGEAGNRVWIVGRDVVLHDLKRLAQMAMGEGGERAM